MSDEAQQPIDDGGPAFPVPSYVNAEGQTHASRIQGMSLRDWFAGQVLAAILSTSVYDPKGGHGDLFDCENIKGDCSNYEISLEWAPESAYAFADRMIAARKARP